MKTILLTIALLVGFASTALAGPDQQTPKWGAVRLLKLRWGWLRIVSAAFAVQSRLLLLLGRYR